MQISRQWIHSWLRTSGHFINRSTAILVSLMSISSPSLAGKYYFINETESLDHHYSSADDACAAAYSIDLAKGPPLPDTPNPDLDPELSGPLNLPPRIFNYYCSINWRGDKISTARHYVISRHGDECTATQAYNPVTGDCESPDTEQDRKELGDPLSNNNVGFSSCGDPVNPANGNVYEAEVDYTDPDGGLRYTRNYNSSGPGGWSTTFYVQLYLDQYPDNRGAVVQFEDGRTALFSFNGDQIIPDGGEFGTLERDTSGWIYGSPDGEKLLFDASGRLTRRELPGGRFMQIDISEPSPSTVDRKVTDHLGHTLIYTTYIGLPKKLVVDDLIVDYTVDAKFRITEVRKNRSGRVWVRKYLYEDQRFPTKLTGIVDERGVRASTWAYDANGRAVSASMANGNGEFKFAYDSPTQTTVTNPLGHPVRYGFTIVQGAKRTISIDGEPIAGCPAANSTFTYTPDARLATRTNALGQLTTFSYDTQGRETSRTEAKGTPEQRTTTTTWDGTSFRPATVTTADRVTSYTYDANGRPISTTVRSLKD